MIHREPGPSRALQSPDRVLVRVCRDSRPPRACPSSGTRESFRSSPAVLLNGYSKRLSGCVGSGERTCYFRAISSSIRLNSSGLSAIGTWDDGSVRQVQPSPAASILRHTAPATGAKSLFVQRMQVFGMDRIFSGSNSSVSTYGRTGSRPGTANGSIPADAIRSKSDCPGSGNAASR